MPACMAGVKAECVHLCRVAGNTVWQVTLHSCAMEFHEELYTCFNGLAVASVLVVVVVVVVPVMIGEINC